MSRSRMARKAQTLAAAAALGAGGLLTAPVAHAAACTVNGDMFRINQPLGNRNYSISANANGSTFGPRAVLVLLDGSGLYGDVTGSINEDKTLSFTVTWDESLPGVQGASLGKRFVTTYTGTIGPDGKASGSASGEPIKGDNFNLYAPGNWTSSDPLNCEGATGGGTAAGKVTVKQASDVYDAVQGNRIEAPFNLAVGKQYTTVQPCADNWCLLNIPELPGGGHGNLPPKQGFVYAGGNGDTVFLEIG